MKCFPIDALPAGFGQGEKVNERFYEQGNHPWNVRMRPGIIGLWRLLHKMGGYASGGVAAAMVAVGSMMTMFTAIGSHVFFHTYHAVGMVMVGNDGNHQYYHTDEKQYSGYVLFPLHSFSFWTDAKIEVRVLITKCGKPKTSGMDVICKRFASWKTMFLVGGVSLQLPQRVHLLLLEEFIDAAQMFFHLFVAEFIHFGHQAVQEVTVVADDNQCAVKVH